MNKKSISLLLLASIALLSVAGVKVSKLTRTQTFASNDLFIVVTGSTTKVTRHIRASDLAVGLGPWITNASMAGGSATNAVTSTNGNQFAGVPLSIKTGSTETNKVFYPSTINARPVTIYGVQGQDADLLRVNDYLGNILFGINYDGSLFGEGATDSPRLTGTSTAGYVWTAIGTDGKGSWVAASGGGISASNANQFGASTTLSIKDGALLTNTSIRTALTLPTLTVSRAALVNSSGQLTNSAAVSDVELEYLDGVTSAIQTQLGSKQAGSFILTNFIAMGITNIVSANANTVITTNAGVLTLTTAGTGSPGGSSADIQFNQSGSFAGTNTLTYDRTNNTLTAGSFIGSGTGKPIIKLQTMMSADNAFAITVATNRIASTTNTFDFTNAAVNDVIKVHSSSAGQVVWTNGAAAGGSQTPWAQNIDGGGYSLTNVQHVNVGTNINAPSQNSTLNISGTNSAGSMIGWEITSSNALFRLRSSTAPTAAIPLTVSTSGVVTATTFQTIGGASMSIGVLSTVGNSAGRVDVGAGASLKGRVNGTLDILDVSANATLHGVFLGGANQTNSQLQVLSSSTVNSNSTINVRSGNTNNWINFGAGSFDVVAVNNPTFTAPFSMNALQGAQLWSDGTNLCVVLQNSGGTRTTNKLSMTAWP